MGNINWGDFNLFFTTGIPSSFLFSSIVITVLIIVIGLTCDIVHNKKVFIIWALFIEYLLIVFCSTVVFRRTLSAPILELSPLWTYKSIARNVIGVSVWDIILNIVLFIPLGFFSKLLSHSLKLWKMIIIALLCSMFIEVNQFIFAKGIAQTDDLVHNTIGAVVGWGIAKSFLFLISNKQC